MSGRGLWMMAWSCAALLASGEWKVSQAGLLVVNADANSISRVAPNGSVTTWASSGLNFPLQIATDVRGGVYVTNGNDGTVHRYSPTGADLGTFAAVPWGASGLATDPAGNVYVGAWFGDGTIHKFEGDGTDLGSLPQIFYNDPTIGYGPANYFAISMTPLGGLVATDDFFGRLYQFAADGTLLSNTSVPQTSPFGLAVDASGNLFIGGFDGNIRELSSSGADLGDFATNLGGIVTGLTFDRLGNLYASVYDTGIVEKFAPDGTDLGIYASGLSGPAGLVFESSAVPAPGTLTMLLGAAVVCLGIGASRRLRPGIRPAG